MKMSNFPYTNDETGLDDFDEIIEMSLDEDGLDWEALHNVNRDGWGIEDDDKRSS
jgi:hypothetical protein